MPPTFSLIIILSFLLGASAIWYSDEMGKHLEHVRQRRRARIRSAMIAKGDALVLPDDCVRELFDRIETLLLVPADAWGSGLTSPVTEWPGSHVSDRLLHSRSTNRWLGPESAAQAVRDLIRYGRKQVVLDKASVWLGQIADRTKYKIAIAILEDASPLAEEDVLPFTTVSDAAVRKAAWLALGAT